jgi:hypothetical protein
MTAALLKPKRYFSEQHRLKPLRPRHDSARGVRP